MEEERKDPKGEEAEQDKGPKGEGADQEQVLIGKLRRYLFLARSEKASSRRGTPELIKHVVEDLGCCLRCLFRFLELRDFALYQESNSFLHRLTGLLLLGGGATDPNIPSDVSIDETIAKNALRVEESKPCPACFGLLQNITEESLAIPLMDKIRNCGYEFTDYQLAVTVPPSILLRQHIFYHHLKSKYGDSLFPEDRPDRTPEVKEAMKWVLGPLLRQRMGIEFKFQSEFNIRMVFTHPETASENLFLEKLDNSGQGKRRKRSGVDPADSITVTNRILGELSGLEFRKAFLQSIGSSAPPTMTVEAYDGSLIPSRPSTHISHDLAFEHLPVFCGGRYLKFVRDLSQSPWFIEGERKTEDSVEELIGKHVLQLYRADGYRFSSAGREDVDVRMLGTGRPFTLEMLNPRRPYPPVAEFGPVEEKINTWTHKIAVRHLQPVSKADVALLKEGEEEKRKTYRCIVWVAKELQGPQDLEFLKETKDLVLNQLTPVRVLHRRTLATRPRTVYTMKPKFLNNHFLSLELTTQAGTYVKEFIHGDLGRTIPNFGTLMGCEVDILQLDVAHIDLEWPPSTSSSSTTPSSSSTCENPG